MMQPLQLEDPFSEEIQVDDEEIRRIINTFNIEELRKHLKHNNFQFWNNIKHADHLMEVMEQHLAQVVTELQTNPKYDCFELLEFLLEFLLELTNIPRLSKNRLIPGSENLLKIIEYTEDLRTYDVISQILLLCFTDIIKRNNEILPRILYLWKIFYYHINFLGSQKVNLIDYYYQDPKYREFCQEPIESLQFDVEYFEPTKLDESYEDLQKNFIHSKKLEGQLQKKIISIVDDNSSSALTLSRNLLNLQNQPLSPLIEIVKFRILIQRGLQTDPKKTKSIIVGLHLKSLKFLEQRLIFSTSIFKTCYHQIIGKLEQTDNKNLFRLETIEPKTLTQVIVILSNYNNLARNEKNQEFLLKLVTDVLSMSHMEENEQIQGFPLKYNSQILSQQLAMDGKLTSCILLNFLRLSFRNEVFSQDVIQMLLRVLNIQDNKLMLLPEQFGDALQLFSCYCLKNPETLNQNFDDLLSIIVHSIKQGQNLQKPSQQGYVQISDTEADSITKRCLKILSSHFEFNQIQQTNVFRTNQAINIDTMLSNKILNSNILDSFAEKFSQEVQFTDTAQLVLSFISCLTRVAPDKTERIIDSKTPVMLNDIIQRIRIEELDLKKTIQILDFYLNICLQEKGFLLFSNSAVKLISDLLQYHLVVQDNLSKSWLQNLGYRIRQIINSNNRMKIQLIEPIQQIYQQALEQLNNRIKNLKFDQEGKTEFKKIVQKKNAIISFNKDIRLQSNGIIDVIKNFFKIPSFNIFYSSIDTPTRIIETVLQIIESWEADLGQKLDNAQLQYLNEQQFFDQFSPQNLTIVGCYSEIFHCLSAITFQEIRTTATELRCKLLEKLCPLFGLVIVTKDSEQLKKAQGQFSDIGILIGLFQDLTRIETNIYLEPIGKFFEKLSQYLVSYPNATTQQLILISTLLQIIGPPFRTKLQILLIDSSFKNNLLNTLKNYNGNDQQNSKITKELDLYFEQVFQYLYNLPRSKQDLVSILPKIIQDISSLYQIIIDSDQENLIKIIGFLTTKIGSILNLESKKNSELIKLVEEMGYSRQLILEAFNINSNFTNQTILVNFLEENRNLLEQRIQQGQQQEDFNLEMIEAQKESLKIYIKTNILRFSASQVGFLDFPELEFDQTLLFKYLQQTAYQQFNLKLYFQGVEFENTITPPPWSIVVILKLLSQQKHFTEQQDLIAIEMIKILDKLLQQPEICKHGIQAINFTLSILTKLINNNQEVISLLLNGIKKILDLQVQVEFTVVSCINALIKVFSKNRQSINQFIQEFEGLELLYKLKGKQLNHTTIFGRLGIGILSDQITLRAQIEAKIKKIIFDQENNQEIKKSYQTTNGLYFQNENAYPICLKPIQHNIQANKQWKIKKNNPKLLELQNDVLFKEEVKEVMNLLFIESEEEQCYILKNGIELDTLNSINQNEDSITQFNFKHTKETQIFFKFLVQKLIQSYFDTNTQHQFNWKAILEVLLFLIQKFPILLPVLLRINCSQYLQQYKHNIGYELQELPTQISFLSMITRFIQPSHNFLFYICLDNLILFRKSNNIIVPFANEIRRLIIKQLFSEISIAIKTCDEKLKNLTLLLGILLQIKSVAKICIKNINEPQESFNFVNLYIEGIKKYDLQQYFIYKDQIYFILTILNLLYNVATYFLLEQNEPKLTYQHQQNMMNNDNQQGRKIIGEMRLKEIQSQLFSFNQKYLFDQRNPYKISKLYLQQWPLFTEENFSPQTQTLKELTQNEQLNLIQNNLESREITAVDLEHEENQFINQIGQEANQETYKSLENKQVLDDFVNAFINNQIQVNIQFTVIFQQLRLPRQFQHYLQRLRGFLVQDSTEVSQIQQRVELVDDIIRLRFNMRQENNTTIQVIGRQSQNHLFQENIFNQQNNDNLELINENFERNAYYNNADIVFNDENLDEDNIGDQFQQQEQQNEVQQTNQNMTLENVNCILDIRRYTLKNLGKLDDQLIQFLMKFLCIKDVEANLNGVLNFLKTLVPKMNITNLIINNLIQILKQLNESVQDCKQGLELVKKRVLEVMVDLQNLQKCQLSTNTFKELISSIELFQGQQLNLLIQFMGNQEQISIPELSEYQINALFNNMLKEKDLEFSNNYVQLISKLLGVSQNRKHFFKLMEDVVENSTDYYQIQLENRNTSDSCFYKIYEVEKIFQLLQIAYKQGPEEQSSCEKFLNSLKLEKLMKLAEQVISRIPKEQVQKYYPAISPIFSILVISNQILNPNNPEQLLFLTKLASMEMSNSLSGSLEIGVVDFESFSREICRQGKTFINYIIKQKLRQMKGQILRRQQPSRNTHDFEFQNIYVDYFFLNHSKCIDFENKKLYFQFKLTSRQRKRLSVRRNHIFEDSYNKIKSCDPQLLTNITVIFEGEQGIDVGGLSKEWMQLLMKEIVDPNNKLFIPTSNNLFCQINRESYQDPDYLNKFKFIGRIFAIAITNGLKVFGRFPISFFKHIIGQKLSIFDISYHDEGLYQQFYSLYYSKSNTGFEQYFLYTIVNNGRPEDLELKQGGEEILVTQENKKEFIKLYCDQIMAKNTENQMKAFLEGFYSVIPRQYISIFDSTQLEQLLCGQNYIDVDDLINNLQYIDFAPQNEAIKWLQNTLRSFSQDLLAKFLKFVTSLPLAPIGGFQNSERKIQISKFQCDFNMTDQVLPVGHTCLNQLELPPYSQEQILAAKLELAITEGSDEFTLA
ncbi:unnamed protein product [Paramecium octaurelia]|uniref:HECT domain-containing protein n=1 Tax=Paramecium octaurelia TaxID=43137 RepID=A0A8S1XUE5_PAROT|nr:unnamed protein product [Paramecium octaurelia]